MNFRSVTAGGAAVLFLGAVFAGPVLGDEIFVRNAPFERAVYVEDTLYAPLADFMQALHMHWVVDPQTKRLIFKTKAAEGGDTLPEGPVFEGEYEGTVFPVSGIFYEGEIWAPVRFVAERLGFTVHNNPSTGIIDIVKPRNISQADRDCARELEEEHEARVKRAEEILAARRAEKKAKLQREAEEAAAAEKKRAAEKAAKKRSPQKKAVKSVGEGSFPSEFDEYDDITAPAVKPGRAAAAPEEGGAYPKAKNGAKNKKKAAPAQAVKAAEPAPEKAAAAESGSEKAAESAAEDVPAKAFVTYMAPLAEADYSTGDFRLSASICNRSETEARNVKAVLSVCDLNGRVIIKKTVNVGTLAPGKSVSVKESGRHPQRGSMPRGDYRLQVELSWE